MSTRIRFQGGPLAGRVFFFGDESERIVIGRDPDQADVLLPADESAEETVQPEDAEIEAPVGFDVGRYRLTGNVSGEPPFKGRLVHHGWEVSRTELPQWSGSDKAASVIAPVELELS